jgi:hypothetical protein
MQKNGKSLWQNFDAICETSIRIGPDQSDLIQPVHGISLALIFLPSIFLPTLPLSILSNKLKIDIVGGTPSFCTACDRRLDLAEKSKAEKWKKSLAEL